MSGDIRISFIGDSFVQGIGDPEYRGWVGRVLAATDGDITAFNLGIRRDTSEDVLRRCWQEILPRTRSDAHAHAHAHAHHRLVVSFGSNDTIEENGTVRVAPARTLAHLASLLAESGRRSIAPLVVGPPPVVGAGQDHLRRTSDLADRMAALCRAERIPFIATTQELADDPVWTEEALAGDGAHPGSGGYRKLADLVLAAQWHPWITDPHS